MKERDIVYSNTPAWVFADPKQRAYIVMEDGLTHATSDSAYELSDDGLSIAKARCDYLAKRRKKGRT